MFLIDAEQKQQILFSYDHFSIGPKTMIYAECLLCAVLILIIIFLVVLCLFLIFFSPSLVALDLSFTFVMEFSFVWFLWLGFDAGVTGCATCICCSE